MERADSEPLISLADYQRAAQQRLRAAPQRLAHSDGELATARGAKSTGANMCLSTLGTVSAADLADAAPSAPRWFQLDAALALAGAPSPAALDRTLLTPAPWAQ